MSMTTSETCQRLLKEAADAPIEAIEECQSIYQRAESTHNQKIRETLAVAAAIVLKLRASPADLEAFDEHPFWEGSRASTDVDRLPRRVVRFVLGAKTAKGALYEQARSYGNLVSDLLDEGLSPSDILQRLGESSIHKVVALIPKPRRRTGGRAAATPTTPAQRSIESTHVNKDDTISCDTPEAGEREKHTPDDSEPADVERDQENDTRAGRSIRPEQPEVGRSIDGSSGDNSDRRPTFKTDRDVSFDADRYFGMILDIEDGDEVTVTLRREASDKTWVKLRAINAQRVLRSRPPRD